MKHNKDKKNIAYWQFITGVTLSILLITNPYEAYLEEALELIGSFLLIATAYIYIKKR